MQRVLQSIIRTRQIAQGMSIKKQWNKENTIAASKYFSPIGKYEIFRALYIMSIMSH